MTGFSAGLNVHDLLAEQDFVRRLARSLVFEQDHVDDVVQEAWLAAAQRPPREAASARGWFARVIENLARRRARDEARRLARERRAAADEAQPAVDAVLAREELRARVVAAVVALPEPYRGVVLARYFDAKEPSEIARERQAPAATVRSQLKRALDLLRQRLDSEHGSDRRRWSLALLPLARPEPATGLLSSLSLAAGAWLVVKLVGVGLGLVAAVLGILWTFGGGDAAAPAGLATKEEARKADAPGREEPAASAPATVRSEVTSAPSGLGAPGVPARANAGFKGRVVREGGAPAAGELVRFSGLQSKTMLADAGRDGRNLEIVQGESRSGEDGRFVVEGLAPSALYAVTLGADGKDKTLRLVPGAPGPDEIVDLGDLMLVTKAAVTGRVLDDGGAPVPDAEVLCLDLPQALGALLPFERLVPAHGGFLSVPVPAAAELADLESHASRLRSYLGSDLFVEAGIDKQKAIETFVVESLPWLDTFWSLLPIGRARTGGDGKFRLEGAPTGSCWLVVRKAGFAPGGKPRIVLRAGETRDLGDLTLGTGEEVSGRVLAADARPVPGAEVRVAVVPALGYRGVAFAEAPCTCDAEGRFRVRGLGSGRVLVGARRAPGERWHVEGPLEAQPDLEVRLAAGATLELAVADASGAAVEAPALRLFVGPWLGELRRIGVQQELAVERRVRSAGAGKLEVKDLEPGVYSLRVCAKGFVPGELMVRVPSPEPVAVRLAWCAPLRVVVRTADGKPLAGASVYVQQDGDAGPDRAILPTDYGLPRWRVLPHLAGATDAQGVLETSERPTASVAVHVMHPTAGRGSVSVAETQHEAAVTLEPPGTIRGQLFDHGKPADPKRWALAVERSGSASEPDVPFDRTRVTLQADGSFLIEHLVPGKYELSGTPCADEAISLQGLVEKVQRVVYRNFFESRGSTREVELAPGATVAVKFDTDPNAPEVGAAPALLRGVLAVDGVPCAGAQVVRSVSAFESLVLAEVAADGTFSASLPGGKRTILVTSQKPELTWEGTLDLEPGVERFLDLRLTTGTLAGTAAFATDAKAEGHTVIATGKVAGGELERQAKIDAAGRFVLHQLPPGEEPASGEWTRRAQQARAREGRPGRQHARRADPAGGVPRLPRQDRGRDPVRQVRLHDDLDGQVLDRHRDRQRALRAQRRRARGLLARDPCRRQEARGRAEDRRPDPWQREGPRGAGEVNGSDPFSSGKVVGPNGRLAHEGPSANQRRFGQALSRSGALSHLVPVPHRRLMRDSIVRPAPAAGLLPIVSLALLTACGGGGGGGSAPPVRPATAIPTSSSTVALSGDDTTLVAINQDLDTVSFFDVTANVPTKTGEVAVGGEPRSVTVLPNAKKAYVANATTGNVSVLDIDARQVTKTIGVGTEPRAIVCSPNGTRVYVANSVSGTITVIDTSADTVVTTITIPSASGTHPRALAVTSNGDGNDTDEKVYAACFFAELRPGKSGLDEGQDDAREGRVVVIRASDNTIAQTIALSPMANTGFKSNGSVLDFVGTTNGTGGTNAPDPANPAVVAFDTGAFPNQLAALAVKPGSKFAYVVGTGASPNGPVGFNFNAQGLVSTFDTSNDQELVADTTATVHQKTPLNLNQGLKQDTATLPVIFQTNPVAIAWRPDGSEAWIAIQNSDLLVRLATSADGVPTINAPVANGGASITRIDLEKVPAGALAAKAPRGLVINRKNDRLFVQSFVTRSLTAIDLASRTIVASVATASLPQANTPDATVQLGAELFFTGRGPEERMSSESWGGCVICHPDGLSDSITWMFDGGPRQTIPLDGMFDKTNTHDQRILNWSAVRDENADFELNTRNVFGGRGLIEDDRVLFTVAGASGTNPDDKSTIGQYHQLLNTHATTNIQANNAALPALLAARRDFGIATLDDGKVYVIGGRSGAGDGSLIGAANAVVEFDPKTNTVRARSSTGFTLRHSLGASAITTSRGTRIYAVGGYTATPPGTAPSALNQEYDPATDTWRAVLSLPVATAEFGIATPGLLNKGEPTQTLHVLGGNRGSITTPSVTGALVKFDADPNGPGTWTTFSFTITARRNLGAAAVVRGAFPFHVFALGGRDSTGTALTTVESYVGTTTQATLTDPTALVATPITQLPSGLHSFGIGTSNNRIYVVGGVNAAGADQTAVLELNPAANPAGGTAGTPGTPSGAFTTKAPLPAAARSLGVSSPRTVANFLALKSSGRDARQDAINEWVKRAVRSHVAQDGDATLVAQGRTLFGQAGLTGVTGISCASCHGGPKWTRSKVDFAAPPSPDLLRGNEEVVGAELRKTLGQPGTAAGGANGVLVDVGTFVAARPNEVRPNAADASQRIAALGANGFQAPSLLSVGATAPYLHNGIAKTLEQVLDGSLDGAGASPLKDVHEIAVAANRAAVVAFLKSIDAKTTIFP